MEETLSQQSSPMSENSTSAISSRVPSRGGKRPAGQLEAFRARLALQPTPTQEQITRARAEWRKKMLEEMPHLRGMRSEITGEILE